MYSDLLAISITPLSRAKISMIDESHAWRLAIYERDKLTCQKCGTPCRRKTFPGKLPVAHAHHIKPVQQLIFEYGITSWLQATVIPEFWDISNGVCLCIDCHRKTDSYGKQLIKHEKSISYKKKRSK